GKGRGLWLPVDPTFNQFPADATHLRLARGGLEQQTAIVPLIGKAKMAITQIEFAPNTSQVLVGRQETDARPLSIDIPRRAGPCGCWASPCPGASR
ncbi:MAG TPA: hypothetical protein VNT81_09590, partial [Vicinamibacterales bacterium]|nr:hypothetical protein [Vicinamibacterales bacterium]